MNTVQWIRTRAQEQAPRFLLTQLTHTAITVVVLAVLLFGAAWVGVLDGVLVAVAQTYSTESFTVHYQGRLADINGNPIDNVSPGIDMTFSLYATDTADTPLWSETHINVPVSQGLFNVRLGSINPLTVSLLPEGDLWLGIQVEGDPEMTPRQLLGGEALRALHTAEAELARKLNLEGDYIWSDGYGHSAYINYPDADLEEGEGAQVYINNVSTGRNTGAPQFQTYSYNGVMGVSTADGFELQLMVEELAGGMYEPPLTGYEAKVYIGGHIHPRWPPRDPYPYQPGGLTVYANGDADLDGLLSTGAIIENNLQLASELAAERIDRFSEGDVLCWGEGRLELCAQAGDPLVQAVADANGKPIVIGAEVIKVLGPVHRGDLLVASDVPGYAMTDNDPRPGTVIAQALDDFDGEQELMKAMIRKF
jgi:hypothetical protein